VSEIRVTEGSDNVFADLEVPDAEEELLKAQLTYEIRSAIEARGLTRVRAAELLGIGQAQASMLMRNRSGSLSVARLMHLLTRLGQDVQITVRPTPPEHPTGRVRLLVQPPEPAPAPV